MADEADIAAQQEALQLRIALANTKQPVTTKRTSKTCLNCGEPTEKGHPFCDADCRDDYDYRQQRR